MICLPWASKAFVAWFTAQINWGTGTFSSFSTSFSSMRRFFKTSRTSSLGVQVETKSSFTTPDMTIILWNRPSASGICPSTVTFIPPPDWPKMVTLSGSPPKQAMLSRTQRRASTRSAMPTFTEFQYFSPKADRSR